MVWPAIGSRDAGGQLRGVNNVGVERYGSAEEIDEADWEFVIGTNLTGAWLMSRAALPLMRASGGG
jgi:NAD(P)-dependent dehydrogenase (short-subunit alcohol dehydrogenase family)